MHKALLLFKVRWKQNWRQSRTAGGSSLPMWLTLLLIMLPASGLLAFAIGSTVYSNQNGPLTASRILILGLAAYYLYSLLSPFFGKELGDTQEIEKAKLYPFPASTLYAVTLAFSVFSPGLFFLLPSLVILLFAAASHPAGFVANLVILALYVLHTAQIRIAIALLFTNLLRKRRYQDLLRFLMPLVGVFIFTAIQFTFYSHPHGITGMLLKVNLPGWTGWLPPFWHSGLISPRDKEAVLLIYQLTMVLLSTILLGALGIPLLKRALLYEAENSSTGQILERDWNLVPVPGDQAVRSSTLRGPLWAVFRKELRMMRREPAVKTLLIQQSFLFLLPFVGVVARTGFDLDRILARGMDILLPSLLILLYVEFQVCFLSLGFEGRAIQHLLMTPIHMGTLMAGKNLAFGVVTLVWNSLLVVALSTLFGAPEMGPVYLLLGFSLLLVVTGWGSLSSVILPVPVTTSGKSLLSQSGSERQGCLFALWNYVDTGVLILLSLPPLLLYHFRGLLEHSTPGNSLLPLGASLVYGMLVYLLLFFLATRLLDARQHKVYDLFVQAGR